jgi:hypothetical protein
LIERTKNELWFAFTHSDSETELVAVVVLAFMSNCFAAQTGLSEFQIFSDLRQGMSGVIGAVPAANHNRRRDADS